MCNTCMYFFEISIHFRMIAINPMAPLHPQLSLPSIRQPVQRVIIPDQYGIDRSYAVTGPTLNNVRSMVSTAEASLIGQQGGYYPPPQPALSAQPSTASLSTAASQHSSQASLGPNIQQGGQYNLPQPGYVCTFKYQV